MERYETKKLGRLTKRELMGHVLELYRLVQHQRERIVENEERMKKLLQHIDKISLEI